MQIVIDEDAFTSANKNAYVKLSQNSLELVLSVSMFRNIKPHTAHSQMRIECIENIVQYCVYSYREHEAERITARRMPLDKISGSGIYNAQNITFCYVKYENFKGATPKLL